MEDRIKRIERFCERRVVIDDKVAAVLGEYKRQIDSLMKLGKALTDSVLELNDRVKELEGGNKSGQDVQVYVHKPKKDKLH